jgi:hypothetical protein
MAGLSLQMSTKENEAPLPTHSVTGLLFGARPSADQGKKGKEPQVSHGR